MKPRKGKRRNQEDHKDEDDDSEREDGGMTKKMVKTMAKWTETMEWPTKTKRGKGVGERRRT